MFDQLNAALHDELDDVKKYMLMSAEANDRIAPLLRMIAHEELRHAKMIIEMIHEIGADVTDAEAQEVEELADKVKNHK